MEKLPGEAEKTTSQLGSAQSDRELRRGPLTLEAEGDLVVVVLEEGPHLPLGLAVVGEAAEEGG